MALICVSNVYKYYLVQIFRMLPPFSVEISLAYHVFISTVLATIRQHNRRNYHVCSTGLAGAGHPGLDGNFAKVDGWLARL